MDILRMILTEFWPFVAAVILIAIVFNGIAGIAVVLRSKGGDE